MTVWLSWPLRYLLKPLTAAPAPRQIALGFALGMLVGLVPKGNLIAVALATVLLAANANLGVGAMAVCCFSWIGWLLDPASHAIGAALLFADPLIPFWSWLYHLPLAPWLALNNTVVLGSLMLGLVLAYPVYRAARQLAEWSLPRLHERLRNHHAARLLLGLDAAEGGRA
jgi:uncharacterized protein (TIGR03546 family)